MLVTCILTIFHLMNSNQYEQLFKYLEKEEEHWVILKKFYNLLIF